MILVAIAFMITGFVLAGDVITNNAPVGWGVAFIMAAMYICGYLRAARKK